MYMFSVFTILIFSFKIKYSHGATLNTTYFNYYENGLQRTIRQSNVEQCIPPTITHGNISILKQKTYAKKNFLSLNVTCDYNYVLQPPDDYLMSCINGFWDVDETPQCKRCVKRSANTDIDVDSTDLQLICPESLFERTIFKDCGHRIDKTHQPFVVNGTLSKFAEFPWHVAIYKKDQIDSHPTYHCGGSIINEKSILTVAHCLSDAYGKIYTSREYYAAAGKYHRHYNSDIETTQKRNVVRINLHHRYKGELTNYAWDIAVVIVDEPFSISTLVHPVCIDWQNRFENEQLSPEKYGEVAGWGKTEINLNSAASELRVLKVPFINADECNSLVPNSFIRYITPDKFCAGYTNGSSVCDGDSGGGLVFERQEKGLTKYYIRGLVSVGLQNQGRCDDYKYSTYTKISEYIPFIQECIQNEDVITTTTSSVSSTTTNQPESTESSTDASISCTTPNNEEAKCISIHDCKIFISAILKSLTPDVRKFLKESVCGKLNEKKVCCGSTATYSSIIHSNPATNRPMDKNFYDLPPPGVCGRRTQVHQGNIDGESVPGIFNHPWVVMLEFGTPENSAGFLCAGALINQRYVLTAAHCAARTRIIDSGQLFRVRLGQYTEYNCVNVTNRTGLLPNGRNCTNLPLNVNIRKIQVHPSYNGRKKLYDVALLRLAQDISYTDFIKPICLPLHGEKSLPGKQMAVVDWERSELDNPNPVKKEILLSSIADEECSKIYTPIRRIPLESSHMCAINKNKRDSCGGVGVSGGPLMSTLFNSTDIYIEGVLSFADACGDSPIIATKVTSVINWILNVIRP